MPFAPRSLAELADAPFDDVVDVRSPGEFAEDHLPGAISLPVLSNSEREEVGTIYVRVDRFMARRIGAAHVSRNAARHLQGPLAQKDGGWRPLVYCGRGGMRSGSFAHILKEVGWRADTLEGGYRTWRRLVSKALYDDPIPFGIMLIDGNTGTAKTDILLRAREMGAQAIDLEGLANHRGSVFGHRGGQPSQKLFETRLAQEIARINPSRPVLVEAESAKVGERFVPPSLWKAMRAAPRVRIEASLPTRAAYTARSYADVTGEGGLLHDALTALVPIQGHAQVDAWRAMAEAGDHEALAADLMERHYDPRYAASAIREGAAAAQLVTLTGPGEAEIEAAAAAVAALVAP